MKKDSELLSKYYEGVLNQLQGEVDFINEIFLHQGLKGEGNETAIRNLIKKFIPKKYSVGSGLIVDSEGKSSKQSDIIIYDNQNYPEILSLSSTQIFPVDSVYATIEVKTTLDSRKARQAIENIKSVRSLKYIKDSFRTYPIDPITELKNDTVFWEVKETIPPIGIVFAFRSSTIEYKTFANWFVEKKNENTSAWPSHVFCLDQGLLVAPGWHEKRKLLMFPLVSGEEYFTTENGEIEVYNNKEWGSRSGRLYPITRVGKEKILIDQSKALLHFVFLLTELLSRKVLSPNIKFRENYITPNQAILFEIQDGEKIIVRRG